MAKNPPDAIQERYVVGGEGADSGHIIAPLGNADLAQLLEDGELVDYLESEKWLKAIGFEFEKYVLEQWRKGRMFQVEDHLTSTSKAHRDSVSLGKGLVVMISPGGGIVNRSDTEIVSLSDDEAVLGFMPWNQYPQGAALILADHLVRHRRKDVPGSAYTSWTPLYRQMFNTSGIKPILYHPYQA